MITDFKTGDKITEKDLKKQGWEKLTEFCEHGILKRVLKKGKDRLIWALKTEEIIALYMELAEY